MTMTFPEALRNAARPTTDEVAGVLERAMQVAVRDGAAEVAVVVHDTPSGPPAPAGPRPRRRAVTFGEVADLMVDLAHRVSPRIVASSAGLDPVRHQLDEYFEGSRTDFDLPLDWRLSSGFRLGVLRELVAVGYGETVSYQELARRSGRPKASRAVGSAMAANPIPVIVPCHRVLRTGGALGGYAGGLEAKRRLLTLEGVLLT